MIRVTAELAVKAKIAAALEGKTLNDILFDLVKNWVESVEDQRGKKLPVK